MSPGNLYFRFFTTSRVAAEREGRRVCRDPGPDHGALLGLLNDELVGVAGYELIADSGTAEVALMVADGMHGRGIATLLLEHLVSLADARGVKDFTAEVLPGNSAVLQVLATRGWLCGVGPATAWLSCPCRSRTARPLVTRLSGRGGRPGAQAVAASLDPLLAPRSAAVVGAVSRPGSIGRRILLNIRDAGFSGALHAVSSLAGDIEGIPCVASVAALPEAPDLVVVAVPAERVLEVAQECGKRGARSLVVITSGLTLAQGSSLLEATRRAGMA